MVHESMANLRLDRRLLRRQGWIRPEQLRKELEALPDVVEKGERAVDAELRDAGREGSEAPPGPAEPAV